jgi:hypothetical protein
MSDQETTATGTVVTGKAAEKPLNIITMQDGTNVEFPGKRKLVKTTAIQDGKVVVRLDFVNGQTRFFTIPDALLLTFAGHGAEQKLGDELAGLADIDDCVMAIDELINRLYDGKWNAERESSGMAGASVLARAIAELKGMPMDVVRAFLQTKSQAQKLALRENGAVKAIITRIESEKASKKPAVDTDALLESLGSDPIADALAPAVS